MEIKQMLERPIAQAEPWGCSVRVKDKNLRTRACELLGKSKPHRENQEDTQRVTCGHMCLKPPS